MKILSAGIISPRGRGIDCHRNSTPAFERRVAPETLKDRNVLRGMRRADRFCKMAALAAHDAVTSANLVLQEGDDSLGIILLTALGPHRTTFGFLDDVIDYGEMEVSPIKFSHSVHNAAAYYVASVLGSRGPATTAATFSTPFEIGFLLAQTWLEQKRTTHVLVGCVEEISDPFDHIHDQLLPPDEAEQLHPFHFAATPEKQLSEGAVFVLLSGASGVCDGRRINNIPALLEAMDN